jgi:hypothetical protein
MAADIPDLTKLPEATKAAGGTSRARTRAAHEPRRLARNRPHLNRAQLPCVYRFAAFCLRSAGSLVHLEGSSGVPFSIFTISSKASSAAAS